METLLLQQCIPPEYILEVIKELKPSVKPLTYYAPVISVSASIIVALISYIVNRESFIKQKTRESQKEQFKDSIYTPVNGYLPVLRELAVQLESLSMSKKAAVKTGLEKIKSEFDTKTNILCAIVQDGIEAGWFASDLITELQDSHIESFNAGYDKCLNPTNTLPQIREGLETCRLSLVGFKGSLENAIHSVMMELTTGKKGRFKNRVRKKLRK